MEIIWIFVLLRYPRASPLRGLCLGSGEIDQVVPFQTVNSFQHPVRLELVVRQHVDHTTTLQTDRVSHTCVVVQLFEVLALSLVLRELLCRLIVVVCHCEVLSVCSDIKIVQEGECVIAGRCPEPEGRLCLQGYCGVPLTTAGRIHNPLLRISTQSLSSVQ